MGCCLSRGWAYGCRGVVLVPGVREGGSGCTGVDAAAGKKSLAACKIHHIFFKYPVHNGSCNHDPAKFAAGPGIGGGGAVGESARTEMCEIGTCEFLRGFPGDSGTSSDGWEYG